MCIAGYPQVVMIAKIKKTDITSLKKKKPRNQTEQRKGGILRASVVS